jgi:hypothetical protein
VPLVDGTKRDADRQREECGAPPRCSSDYRQIPIQEHGQQTVDHEVDDLVIRGYLAWYCVAGERRHEKNHPRPEERG